MAGIFENIFTHEDENAGLKAIGHQNMQDEEVKQFNLQQKNEYQKIREQNKKDVFNFEEIEAFDERVKKQAEENGIEKPKYVVETKIDGLSAALEYIDGKFVRGATRGNGLVGEDVTENLKTIKTIPQELPEKINITVRGEVFISKKYFE